MLDGAGVPLVGALVSIDAMVPVPLPFTFNYYGASLQEVSIATNGFVSFAGALRHRMA